jgi:hypothetical protein
MKSGTSGAGAPSAVEDMARERGSLSESERRGAARAIFGAGRAGVLAGRRAALQETGRTAVTRDKVPAKAEAPGASPAEKRRMRAAGAAGVLRATGTHRRAGARIPARILLRSEPEGRPP